MSRQRSWCCGFIPGFWWWFLALLGLPLLFLLMTYFQQGVVESDLTNRVSNALSAENMDWAEVDVKHRGRDVMLRGIPPADGDRDRALEIAADVEGVHRVDFESDVLQMTAAKAESELVMPELNMMAQGGKLTLEGSLPSQQDIDNVLQAAGERFGAENVDDQLTVGPGVATPSWLATPDELINILPDKDATLNIADGNVEINTQVNSDNVREDMVARARNLLGGEVIDNIEVRSLPAPEISMALADGKLTLRGKVSSRAQMDALLQAASDRAGAVNVNNQLQVDDGVADAVWLDSANKVITELLREDSSATIVNDTLEFKASVTSEPARNQLVALTNTALKDSGLILVNTVAVTEKPATAAADTGTATDSQGATESGGEAATTAESGSGEATETATAAESTGETNAATGTAGGAVTDQVLAACQSKLDAASKDKQVLFRVNKADIRNASYALLNEVAVIMTDCKATLAGKQVTIGGHTDSDGSVSLNLDLSQRRAAAVRTYLISKGVAAELLSAKGFGESQPIASNNTAAGKAQNRRISFEIKAAE